MQKTQGCTQHQSLEGWTALKNKNTKNHSPGSFSATLEKAENNLTKTQASNEMSRVQAEGPAPTQLSHSLLHSWQS